MSEESSNASESPAPRKGVSKGMLSILGIIAILFALLAYDFAVVSPSVQDAFDKIVKKSIDTKMNEAELSNTEIQKLISKTPSETYEDDFGDTVEVYQWGLPFKKHKLFAIYKNENGKLNFRRHSKDSYSKGDGVVVQGDPNEPGESMDMGGGAAGGGMGGPTEYSAPPPEAVGGDEVGGDEAGGDAGSDTGGPADPSEPDAEGSQPPSEAEPPAPQGESEDAATESSDETSEALPSKSGPN